MRIFVLIPCLVLAACGGGGGGSPAHLSSSGPDPVSASRSVPGGDILMQRSGGTSIRITSTVPQVAAVRLLQGSDYQVAHEVPLTVAADGSWTGQASPEAPLLVQLTLSDGAVIETAPGDFPVQ